MSGVTLNDLFLAAFSGQLRNHERLGREAQRYARKLSMRFAAGLPEDLHDEIFDEAFAQLWAMPDRLSPDRPPLKLYRSAVLLAIRAVRVSYTPPGQRTRYSGEAPLPLVAAEDVDRIPDAATIDVCSVGEGSFRCVDVDRLPPPKAQWPERALENRSEVVAILKLAPPNVGMALRRVYLEEVPSGVVAHALGISRFAMRREIAAFASGWRAAA